MTLNIYKPTVTEFETDDILIRKASDYIDGTIIDNQSQHGIARVLLSGGQTPMPVYKMLGNNGAIDWSNLELFCTDERFVASTSPDSNQFNIIKNFGREIIESCREVNFFKVDQDIAACIQDYDARLDALDDIWFDLTILGIGPDGHIASLFPGNSYLKHIETPTLQSLAPKQFSIKDRVSLSIESILNSREILILLNGENKLNILSELLEGNLPASEFPAKFLLSHPRVKVFCCFQ